MTEKLFYQDSYLAVFEAEVLSCVPKGEHYEAVLSRTAFFPEGGGQKADSGRLKAGEITAKVLDVQEKEGKIYHFLNRPLPVGSLVEGKLDYEQRFSRMQQHTGEHIISGIVNRRFGYHNVGFHLGDQQVTMDYDGVLSQTDLQEIEWEANRAVAENIPVKVLYPDSHELEKITYRSKIEIEGQIRIVQIPGYDSCACCAPHVKETGSIGLIKITGAIHYKGGMRVSMLCGFRALEDYRQKQESVQQISNQLSVKQEEVWTGVCRLEEELLAQKEKNKQLQQKYVEACLKETAKDLEEHPEKCLLLFDQELDSQAMRSFVNQAMDMSQGICGAFCGTEEEGYRYILAGRNLDIQALGRRLNKSFQGRGGGRPPMIQGSLIGKEEDIREFFRMEEGEYLTGTEERI